MLGRRRRRREAAALAAQRAVATVPLEGDIFASLAILPLLASAVASHALPLRARGVAADAASIWGGAILCFLGGVRRGLSFDDPGGAPGGDLLAMLVHFFFGVGGLVSPGRRVSLASLAAGYAALGLIDRTAAREAEAPRYFSRLRPVQAALASFALASIIRAELPRPRA